MTGRHCSKTTNKSLYKALNIPDLSTVPACWSCSSLVLNVLRSANVFKHRFKSCGVMHLNQTHVIYPFYVQPQSGDGSHKRYGQLRSYVQRLSWRADGNLNSDCVTAWSSSCPRFVLNPTRKSLLDRKSAVLLKSHQQRLTANQASITWSDAILHPPTVRALWCTETPGGTRQRAPLPADHRSDPVGSSFRTLPPSALLSCLSERVLRQRGR